ncbi:hypothetical protein PsorP6_006251 [Peronosclerospora sorghi]|uniref:Uncharacterized protein n=1 Tax=Peronosclerospora sorghi TaxID=230839 RepID=A0ACC0W545_9STRA|nr:hypothetical protein PsorP6_006251 [Peronosclerospora sorghi]
MASECDNLRDAERWRRQIIREISKTVADIQNDGSSDHVIRDLNDDINKRIREKRHWERRIVQLGGMDYTRAQPQDYNADGAAILGAAKNLPGVRVVFQQKEEHETRKRTREDMLKHIDCDYYGFRDDEDKKLIKDEEEVENKLRKRALDYRDAADAIHNAQVAGLVGPR